MSAGKPNMFPKPSFQSKTPLEVLYEEREELRNEVMCLKIEVAQLRLELSNEKDFNACMGEQKRDMQEKIDELTEAA